MGDTDGRTTDNRNVSADVTGADKATDTNMSLAQAMGSTEGGTPDEKLAEPSTKGKAEDVKGNVAGGEKRAAWMEQLPEEMRNDAELVKQLGKFGKIGDLAKSYSELEKKLGNSVSVPGKDATQEELASFWGKLGMPKTADEYSMTGDEAKLYRDIAFKAHLTEEQARYMYGAFEQIGKSLQENRQAAAQRQLIETEEALKKEYGVSYGEKMQLVNRGLTAFGGKNVAQKLVTSGLAYDPDVVRMFIKLGEISSEAGASNRSGGTHGAEYKSLSDGGTFTFKDV